MSFWRRLRLYLIGATIGSIFVLFLFGPRATQCSYLPNSRALEEAKFYPITFSETVAEVIENERIDSVFIMKELLGESKIINFGTDEVRATPCRIYRAEYRKETSYDFVYQICKNKTIITELKKL